MEKRTASSGLAEPRYLIVSKKNRTMQTRGSARDVAVFMLGRNFNDWAIYQLQENLPAEAKELETLLQAREALKPVA
jgi:hypothetical protein